MLGDASSEPLRPLTLRVLPIAAVVLGEEPGRDLDASGRPRSRSRARRARSLENPPRPDAEPQSLVPRHRSRPGNRRSATAAACRSRGRSGRLPIGDFRPRSRFGGLESWCRHRHAEANRLWLAKNPDAVEAYNARRRAERREKRPVRPCVVCGGYFDKRPNAIVCSEECRRQRKIEQRRRLRDTA